MPFYRIKTYLKYYFLEVYLEYWNSLLSSESDVSVLFIWHCPIYKLYL